MSDDTPRFLAYRIATAANMLGVSQSKLYVLIDEGKLEKIKLGGISLIPHDSLQRLIERCRPGGDLAPKDPRKGR